MGDIIEGAIFTKAVPFTYWSEIETDGYICGYKYDDPKAVHEWGEVSMRIIKRVQLDGFQDRIFYIPTFIYPDDEQSDGKLKCVALSTFKSRLKPHKMAPRNPVGGA